MSTKTYNYIFEGDPGSIDVTVLIGSCGIPSGDPLVSNLSIDASIPTPLPFALNIYISRQLDWIDSFGSGTFNSTDVFVIPAGETTASVSRECYFERSSPYLREESFYEFIDQPEVQDVDAPLSVTLLSSTNASCFGTPNGSAQVEALGGVAPYSYAWSDGGPNSPARPTLLPGTYSVIVTDAIDNTFELTGIVISSPPQILSGSSVTPVTCFGGNNGAINLTPSGGSGSGYSFSWSDGSTLQNRSGLTAGTYQVTITDSDGCARLFTIIVSQPAQIQITVNKSGQNITNTVTGGTGPYTYLWSDGSTLKDRINIPFGVYSFTVTDANGCVQSTIIVVQEFKFFFSKNPIWLSLSVEDMISKPNLSFVCEVYLEDSYESESFNLKYSSEQPARADGTTDFNMQQVLNAFLDANVPIFGDSVVRFVSEGFKRFYLSYFEKYGEPPVPDDTTVNETFYVLYGGLSEQEFAKQTFFDSYLDTVKPFLTWSPTTQPIASDQHSYLHFVVVNPVFSSLTLKATVRYSDNTSVTADVKSISPVKNFELVRFPAGVQQLALQALNPTKIIVGYDLQLFSGTTELSEKRTYEVYGVKRHYRKLLYLNSLGGWDHILCFGRGKQSLRTQEETISRDLPVGYSYSDREEETVSKSGMLTGELIIATLNGYQRKHLIDLAISEKVYEQTATGYLPVKVKMDFDPEDDFENLDEIGLDIYYPKIRRYTPEL